MFKKKCPKCENKINKNYDFCPLCGLNLKLKEDGEDYGILGKNDILEESFFSQGFGDTFMEKMLGQTMKMLEKQMKKMPENEKLPKMHSNIPISHSIQFFVNGKRVFPVEENNNQQQPMLQQKVKVREMPIEKLERFARLPKKEPNSKVRRIGAKIVYELEVPGVNDLNDILINRLETSIEIKALSNDLVYSKILNVNLPILRYGLNNGNLILELQGR